ncbi:MAG: TlpA disulfide reductase family protein [Sphingorhabdus sp.]
MRFVIALILLVLAGCDTESGSKGQVQPDSAQKASQATQGEIGLESANGMRAVLSYKFAGQSAPQAKFHGRDGRQVALSDYAGRAVLLNLWATWCAPCKAEMPTLDALAALEEGKIAVLAVSQDLEGQDPVIAFFKSAQIENLEPFTDSDNALMSAFGGNIALPTTILYGRDGREVWRVSGGVEWDDAEMAKLLQEAV